MEDPNRNYTNVTTTPARSAGSGGIFLALGAIIVALGVIFWLMTGDEGPTGPAADAPAATETAPVEPAPVEPAPVEPAPAETAPAETAPADTGTAPDTGTGTGGTTAPTAPATSP